jgi:hypothetical protein
MDSRRLIVRSAGALATVRLGGSLVAKQLESRQGSKRVSTRVPENSRIKKPKSRAKKHGLANVVDGIYRHINAPATSERIHKIGVQLLHCYHVRRPSQSRTPAVDPQLNTRPP